METILEQQRRYHEERERLVDTMVKEMLQKKVSVRIRISTHFSIFHNVFSVSRNNKFRSQIKISFG